MNNNTQNLILAEQKALKLFEAIKTKQLIRAGITELELNKEIYELAKSLFDIKKYWHKRIVRAGPNTLFPYKVNPPNLVLQENDILFIDFGPIFEEWEADIGRTYVLGNDKNKLKLKVDVEIAWFDFRTYFLEQEKITGAEFYNYIVKKTADYNWEFGGEIAGHIIGQFPHEKLEEEIKIHYIHPDNHVNMLEKAADGSTRNWILEVHFVDKKNQIGGFFEQLLI